MAPPSRSRQRGLGMGVPGKPDEGRDLGPDPKGAGAVTSRRRVEMAMAHVEADRVPLDLGGGPTTGIHVTRCTGSARALV